MAQSENDLTNNLPDAATMLDWQLSMGADEAIGDTPINWLDAEPESATPLATKEAIQRQAAAMHAVQETKSAPRTVAARPVQSISGAGKEAAEAAANACNTLDQLRQSIEAFDGGALKRSAKNTVFSDGVVGAPLMVIGESPGSEEDSAGKPFIGPAGQLLDKMLAAADFSRQSNAYITNLIPWRPLGNKVPAPEVVDMCLPFVKKHIELAAPKAILLLGGTAAKSLLAVDGGITKLRGKWHDITFDSHTCALLATYHPAYLIRQPAFKGQAWRDLLQMKYKIKEDS